MKVIQTRYKGYHFRSRLEARYAVFFDTLGASWLYEPEGFELKDGTKYLPDFWLSDHGHYGPFVEIKGTAPTDDEVRKLCEVCESKGCYGFILWGNPGQGAVYIHKDGFIDRDSRDNSREIKEALDVLSSYLNYELVLPQGRGYSPAFYKALEAFRSARFEFGQEGATL